MDLKEIYALVDYMVDERLRDIEVPQAKRGLRGPRGFDGKDGSNGLDGKSFSWEEHEPIILKKIEEHKLKFTDLTEDEKRSLRGPRGQRGKNGQTGPKGDDGKSFVFSEHVKEVESLIQKNKDILKGEKGDRGEIGPKGAKGIAGRDGLDFSWDEHEEKIFQRIDSNALTFEKLTEKQKKELKGQRGLRGYKGIAGKDGKDGKDFIWNDHKEEIEDKIKENSLTFDKLTEDQKQSLKGERGPRGQRGRSGVDGLSAYEIWLKDNNGSELDFLKTLKGVDGKNGINGLNGRNGLNGLNGRNGVDGIDGLDAPFIIDIQLKDSRGKFYFVFFLSDGSRIETKSIDKPVIESIIQNTYISKSSSGGSVGSELEIYKDNILIGVSEKLNFVGDNIDVTYDPVTKTSSVSVIDNDVEKCVSIYDEGNQITDCVSSVDFIGENVEVVSGTSMSDWEFLSDVTTLAGYSNTSSDNVKVVIGGQESVAKLGIVKIATQNINQFDIVRLVSSTSVAKGSHNSSNEAKVSGIALNAGNVGDEITVVMFGIVEDVSFNFPLLSSLFLGENGTVELSPPIDSGKFVVPIGESLGAGAIFIKIEEPEGIL